LYIYYLPFELLRLRVNYLFKRFLAIENILLQNIRNYLIKRIIINF
jgi:hypothetical protein